MDHIIEKQNNCVGFVQSVWWSVLHGMWTATLCISWFLCYL